MMKVVEHEDDELLAAVHVGRPNAGIEVDVGLVNVEDLEPTFEG